MKEIQTGFLPVCLWFAKVFVYELYTSWWYDMGVIVYAHFSKAFEYIWVIKPIAEAFDANIVLGSEFGFGFGFAVHVSRYCGCFAQTFVCLTILSPVSWHSSMVGFLSTMEYR